MLVACCDGVASVDGLLEFSCYVFLMLLHLISIFIFQVCKLEPQLRRKSTQNLLEAASLFQSTSILTRNTTHYSPWWNEAWSWAPKVLLLTWNIGTVRFHHEIFCFKWSTYLIWSKCWVKREWDRVNIFRLRLLWKFLCTTSPHWAS